MWERLAHHLEDSRLHLRPNIPSITFKKEADFLQGRFTVNYPLSFNAELFVSSKGFKDASFHPSFSPNVPFYLNVTSDKTYTAAFNFKLPNEKLPEKLRNNTFKFSLSGDQSNYLSSVFALTHQNKYSISLALRPCIIGGFYHGENVGVEFAYSLAEEQPSMSAMFNKRFDRTEVSLMASMYGEGTALITSDFDKVRISSYLRANPFTFDSTATFGIQIPFGNSFGNISFSIPSKTIRFEAALNLQYEEDKKSGITVYWPFSPNTIKSVLA
ncbi:hypothetical protein TVAG_340380 [Trichomonas vaginalis G3]|uniref:Uncharacterized protein n=1 Tax=Trichomonas vaginalis (strain ATCC PRA-98 / G3) TaxID=412133 RepID=A2EKF2_TRIV3|nr:hypothetical protein TVAGG3_0979820 [Trichomonas vaginalis G3]EAY06860.1 hypothetical protein TVAG_340380 [Trichomonas vaginalis G3]KAI5489200.1 hypothetical protein TVAGG3_0979820 [Trichomonas vaginalis G3]|eukprot:XP_001319083.1 hypothetical protein [Trichomonas vaginalis G3]